MSPELEKLQIEAAPPKKPPKIGIRHLQYCLLAICVVICYGVRTTLSVGIIAMTSDTPPADHIPTYPFWRKTDVVLSAFFWGYILPQVGAGQIAERFGAKWFIFATVAINGIFTIVVPPLAAAYGAPGVIFCRVIQGFCQGFLYPSFHTLISKWTPLSARSKVATFVYGSNHIGVVISMVLTGQICDSELGWMYSFYLYGGLSVAWAVLWAVCGANSPSEHSWVSDEERQFLQEKSKTEHSSEKRMKTPWRAILRSMPVWAIFIANCTYCWGNYTLLTEIPSYMSNMMGYQIKNNSKLSALPYLAAWIISFMVSPTADWLTKRRIMNVTNVRKLFQSISYFTATGALLWLAFIDNSQKTLAIVLLIVTVGVVSLYLCGFQVNHIDISPNHAGTLNGFTNGFGNIFSVLGPLSVEWIPYQKTDGRLWRTVFCLTAAFYASSGLFYLIFASGEPQSWNSTKSKEEEEESERKKIDITV